MTDDWWLIGPKPKLADKLPMLVEDWDDWEEPHRCQPNDHTIYRSADGRWQLWACVRRTQVGRLLVNWDAASITDSPWRETGRIIRADREAGESQVDWRGQEFLQSPFVVRHEGTYYMFYGGYDTGVDPDGRPTTDYSLQEKQTCLMTSADGVHWTRHRDEQGRSRLFSGPGAVRDQCVMRHGDTWYIYYAGHHDRDRRKAGIYVRSSDDLLNWSDWSIAQFDTEDRSYIPESPFVVERDGYFYLFRTHGPEGGTYVFRSEDPMNFGRGDLTGREICRLEGVIAPEIVVDGEGNEYISNISVPDPEVRNSIRLRRLEWMEEA
jgi:beta-xylosidase